MLKWLPLADPATRSDGERLVKRALELYKDYVSRLQRDYVTIAVGEVNEIEVAVVFHTDPKTAERIAGRLRKAGISATSTSGNDHAETMLHEREPEALVIAISNADGPCSACKKYFGEAVDGFANLYWGSGEWIK